MFNLNYLLIYLYVLSSMDRRRVRLKVMFDECVVVIPYGIMGITELLPW